jgi:6-phosphogluconolactonase
MGVLAFAAAFAFVLFAAMPTPSRGDSGEGSKLWLYVGTYTGKTSKGIYRFEFDPATGKLSDKALVAETTNPTFLAIHPNKKFLYAVGETGDFGGKKTGAVNAYKIDPKTGDLTLLNQQASEGAGPCHLTVDKAGKNVLVANYGAGTAAVLPIEEDGKLGKATCSVQHKGTGGDPKRQEGPHAHSINLDAANKFAVVADLGIDKLMVYRFDGTNGMIIPNDPPYTELAPGAGPRHFTFHPNGKLAYAINELNSTITVMSYDSDKGSFTKLQSISTLPKDQKGETSCAEVVVHPSGKWVYGSNRGQGDTPSSIAIFKADEKTGELTASGHQGKGIKAPRNFVIDPTGKFMLVGNQGADTVIVFRVNEKTGALEATDISVEVGAPVCLRFLVQKPKKGIFD